MSDINVIVNDEIVNIDVIDEPVLVNVVNSPGVPGAPGQGVPVGGTTGQVLKKLSNTNYDTYWAVDAGGISSIGLTMPSAFAVANSPLTANGTLAVTGAGTSAQYIRGDGQLANFPSGTGGGSAYNYYLNGSVNQGTFGGDVYYEMSKTPVLGAGTNFTRTNGQGNGYIASFITDAGDPSLLNIPGGNWNLEFYFQSSSTGGSPQFYAELYKVNSSNVFTLVASGSSNPEGITNGTTVDQYFTSIPVPQTSLLVTDRLAVRIYVITAGRTITLHTENSNLCEILTTFSTGLNALNGLSAQVQYFATGTSGTDFGISSETDTHTFNLPTASAVNRGALSSADWITFNNKVPASRTLTINGVAFDLSADRSWTVSGGISGSGASGQVAYWDGTSSQTGSADLTWDGTNVVLGNSKGITLQTAGTNRSTRILPNNVADNFSALTFYPSSGTNVGQGLYVIPKGTGFNATTKAQFFLFGTDYVADQTNWEGVLFRATGTAFTLATGKAGSGTIRPLLLSAGFADNTTNPNQLWLYTNGNVGINTTTNGTERLQVQGTTLLNGNVTFSSATGMTWNATNSRLGIGTNAAPSGSVYINNSGNDAQQHLILKNSNTGTGAQVHLDLHNDDTQTTYNAGASLFFCSKNHTAPYASALGFWNYQNGPIALATNGTERLRVTAAGNLAIGSTTDSGERLQVTGTMKVTGNVKIGDSVYTDTTAPLILGINGTNTARGVIVNDGNFQDFIFVNTSISSGNINAWSFGQRRDTAFGNTIGSFQIVGAYVSNSGAFSQVGGGYRVPLICNPNGDVLINGGNANVVNRYIGLGVNAPTALTDIGASTTTRASLRIRSGTAPTTPNDGDIWYDGTNIYMRVGATTKTFTLI
jgi:hypothetical protein